MDALFTANKTRRVQQQISVPFFWEDKPGWPKKEWRQPSLCIPSSPIPIYTVSSRSIQVASIPFGWEEVPGKPLEQFRGAWSGGPTVLEPHGFMERARSNNPFIDDEEDDKSSSSADSFSSCNDEALAIHANHSSVVEDSSGLHESRDSETETEHENWSSLGSSYDSNAASVSVLEFLFPLSSPDAGFLRKSGLINGGKPVRPIEAAEEGDLKGKHNLVVRRTMTLGQLIMLSRKLSCGRRNAARAEQNNFPASFAKKVFTCF